MNPNRKGQIQVFETMAVLVIFFILIFIGFIFYGRMVRTDIGKESYELSQLKSISTAQKVMFFPELQCSDDSLVKENCIDRLKLDSAMMVMRDNEIYYYDMLEFSEINITSIYPNEQKWTVYSRKPDTFKSRFITNVPVLIHDPLTGRDDFGIITIETTAR